MIQIQPLVFPLNLGTANQLIINLSVNPSINGARISYTLIDNTSVPPKRLSNGFYDITEEDFTLHGNDKEWIINYVTEQLGVTLITE